MVFYEGYSPVHYGCIASDAGIRGNKPHMQYGYPVEMTVPLPDPGNDILLISVLKSGGKPVSPER